MIDFRLSWRDDDVASHRTPTRPAPELLPHPVLPTDPATGSANAPAA